MYQIQNTAIKISAKFKHKLIRMLTHSLLGAFSALMKSLIMHYTHIQLTVKEHLLGLKYYCNLCLYILQLQGINEMQ